MKDASAFVVAAIMLVFALRYGYQIRSGEVKPALSTWLTFLVGTGLSLATYSVASKWDLKSGILNVSDVLVVVLVIVATLRWSSLRVKFRPFEKWYLRGAGVIVLFWVYFGDSFTSNLMVQSLIFFGYFPTIHKLVAEKKNTESYSSWGLALIAVTIACYPAIGNTLAMVYAIRSVVMVLTVLVLMAWCDKQSQ